MRSDQQGRNAGRGRLLSVCLLLLVGCGAACQSASNEHVPSSPLSVADTPTRAQTPDGEYISWKEHLIDDEQINGGIPLRGGDGLKMADLDKDGFLDIVSVHEDNHHIRLGVCPTEKQERSGCFEGVRAN